MSIASVTREILVRYLDIWLPSALHATNRATFVQAGTGDAETTEAALRVFGEFADRLRGRRLTVVLIAPDPTELSRRAEAVQRDLSLPASFTVHTIAGGIERIPVALAAATAAGAPLLVHVDGAERPTLDAIGTAGRPAEVLWCTGTGGWPAHRDAFDAAGFGLTAGVDLVDGAQARLLAFATSSAKRLEAFKDSLWAVDEYAGVRFRDPADPDGDLLDISLNPQPGPLRRELLAHLAAAGSATVTELRRFALTRTVYRASDTVRALTALVSSGAVTRNPPGGRLSGDVEIGLPAAAPAEPEDADRTG